MDGSYPSTGGFKVKSINFLFPLPRPALFFIRPRQLAPESELKSRAIDRKCECNREHKRLIARNLLAIPYPPSPFLQKKPIQAPPSPRRKLTKTPTHGWFLSPWGTSRLHHKPPIRAKFRITPKVSGWGSTDRERRGSSHQGLGTICSRTPFSFSSHLSILPRYRRVLSRSCK